MHIVEYQTAAGIKTQTKVIMGCSSDQHVTIPPSKSPEHTLYYPAVGSSGDRHLMRTVTGEKLVDCW